MAKKITLHILAWTAAHRTPAQRVTAAGYIWSNVGENIAVGQRSVEEVMNGWTNSPGHCQNLIYLNFRDVAVACVRNVAATNRLYWTMELGRSSQVGKPNNFQGGV